MSSLNNSTQSARKRIAKLVAVVATLDYVCSGTLLRRRLTCGKKRCCCKATLPKLHGPYYYWSRMHRGKLVQRVLSASQADLIARAIHHHKIVERILRRWEQETVRMMQSQKQFDH